MNVKRQFEILAKIDFAFYNTFCTDGLWKETKHLQYTCKKLEQLEQGEIDRLIVTMPPRHGKSMTISESFPSWFIGKNPSRRVIQVSYGDSLAKKFGRRNRDKIKEYGKAVFNVDLAEDSRSITDWNIKDQRGGMISVGIGGGITGEGADLLIIDDPIKNRLEANSETYRERIWDEYRNTLMTRLHPGGRVIVIVTRWHEDDLVGRIMDLEPGRWELINLPCICEDKDDALEREIGETLWPESGFDETWAESKKIEVGSQVWASLYQQRPSPQEGSMINRAWWKFYDRINMKKYKYLIQSWDCTFKEGDDNDYVVGQVWGVNGVDKYLIDQTRVKMGIVKTMDAIKQMYDKYPTTRAIYIEDKANGPAVVEMMSKKIPGLIAVEPHGGKVVRAQAVSPTIEAGNVCLPNPSIAPWINDFIEECAAFPNGKHDDQVDAMTQALNQIQLKGVFSVSDINMGGRLLDF